MEPFHGLTSGTIAMQGQLLQQAQSLSPRRGHHSNDSEANRLQAIVDTALSGIGELKLSMQVAKELIGETEDKLVSLESQVEEMRTVVKEIRSRKRGPGVVLLQSGSPTSSQETTGRDKRFKANPGRSDTHQPTRYQGETSKFQSSASGHCVDISDDTTDELKAICSDMTDTDAEIVTRAAQESKGVLSPQEFLTFLYLSRQVDDPVQLARISFTEHTTPLYHQLMTFMYNLKKANRAAQGAASRMDTSLEDKFQSLVEAYRRHTSEGV